MIVVTARPYGYNWSGNGIWYRLFSEAAKTDATIRFEVRIQFMRADETDYRLLLTMPMVPNADGTATINWQTVLDAALEYGIPQLSSDNTATQSLTQTAQFYMEFREVTVAASDPSWSTHESDFKRWVIKGGLPEFSFNNNGYWDNFYPATKPFLTWQVKGRMAALTERIYLTWLQLLITGDISLWLTVTVYYDDLTSATQIVSFESKTMAVNLLPAGAAMLQLQTLEPTKKIWYWTLQVQDPTDPDDVKNLSEIFSYEADNRPDYNDLTLLYRNSLGGLDSSRIRGVVDQSTDYLMQEITRVRRPYFEQNNQLQYTRKQLPSVETMIYTGDIGHLAKEEQDRLRDLYLQREVYICRNARFIPINFTQKQFKQRTSTDKRWSLPISFSLGHEGDAFYLPRAVDIGNGPNSTNVCDALIIDLHHTDELRSGDTICLSTWTFGVYSPTGINITKVQYKIDGVTDWIDLVYPYVAAPQTNIATGQFKLVSWRCVCPTGLYGDVNSQIVDTHVDVVVPPVIPPPPPEFNSRIANNTPFNVPVFVNVNGVTVHSYISNAGTFELFNMANADPCSVQLIFVGLTPTNGGLYSNGVVYDHQPITANSLLFNSVSLINGMQVSFY